MVKNPPSNAGDVGLISGQGTKIPHAVGQLDPGTATRETHGHCNEDPAKNQNKREWSAHTCYNLNEICKRDAQWKRLDVHITWSYLYEMSRIGKSIEIESRLVFAKG